jgi:hypothetical protein
MQTQLEGKLNEKPLAKDLLDLIPVAHHT